MVLHESTNHRKTFQPDDCSHCSAKVFCLPVGMESNVIDQINDLVKHKQVLHKGEFLFKAGQKLNVLHVIRSGSFKTFQTINKQEHITAFHLPGEIIGFDALCLETHSLYAEALETSSVCEIAFDDLLRLSSKIPALNKRLLTLACSRQEKHAFFTLTSSAMERVCSFLLNFSSRFKQQGLSAQKFTLSMPRQDIANFLGLTNETTSRMFSQLAKAKIIKIDNRQIDILDRQKLLTYARLA